MKLKSLDYEFPVVSSELSHKSDREPDEGVPRIPDQRIPAELLKALPPSLFAGRHHSATKHVFSQLQAFRFNLEQWLLKY
jgi:hypothetical protein